MIEIVDKNLCCGCSACKSICPKKCITMKYDKEGFSYPSVDEKRCIRCNACDKICPMKKKNNRHSTSSLCAIQNKNVSERNQSTAGGAFSIVANSILEDGGVVYAVGYDENTNVVHKRVTRKEELPDLRGSKYVQSCMSDTLIKIKKDLKSNKKVLFVGTPCQVHAVYNYIGYTNDYLYTIDLLCLGVSSPGLFRKYIDYLEKKYRKKVLRVDFRNKNFGYSTPNIRVTFSDRTFIQQNYDSKVHSNLFFKGYRNVRPSCYSCEFREKSRVSDFTIGDFPEIGLYNKQLDDDKGTTKLWIHTKKGRDILSSNDNVRMVTIEETTANIIGGKKIQISIPKDRSTFFEDAECMEYEDLIEKWMPFQIKDCLVSAMRYILKYMPFGHIITKKMRIHQVYRFKNKVNRE